MSSDRPKKSGFEESDESSIEIVEMDLFHKAIELLLRLGDEGNLIIYGSNKEPLDDISPELDSSIEKKVPWLAVEMFRTVLSQVALTESAFDQLLSEMQQIHIHTDGKKALEIKVVPTREVTAKLHVRRLLREKFSN